MREMTYVQAQCEGLREEMLRDDNLIVMGEDIALQGGLYGTTKGLFNEFGSERIINTPITEAGFVGVAVGAALGGCPTVVELMFIDFAGLAGDMIFNQAAKMRYMSGGQMEIPLVIRTQGGAAGGKAGHHSQSLEAFFCHAPGLKVVMPSTPCDAKGLLKTAIRDRNPVVFIDHKVIYFTKGPVPEEEYLIPFGKADIKRQGKDVTVIATSTMVLSALEAADQLARDGIDVEVLDPRTLVPLDEEAIVESIQKTNRCVVAHQAWKRGGVGAEISAVIMEKAFDYLDAPVVRVAGVDTPMPFNPNLEKQAVPDEDDIVAAVRDVVGAR